MADNERVAGGCRLSSCLPGLDVLRTIDRKKSEGLSGDVNAQRSLSGPTYLTAPSDPPACGPGVGDRFGVSVASRDGLPTADYPIAASSRLRGQAPRTLGASWETVRASVAIMPCPTRISTGYPG